MVGMIKDIEFIAILELEHNILETYSTFLAENEVFFRTPSVEFHDEILARDGCLLHSNIKPRQRCHWRGSKS